MNKISHQPIFFLSAAKDQCYKTFLRPERINVHSKLEGEGKTTYLLSARREVAKLGEKHTKLDEGEP